MAATQKQISYLNYLVSQSAFNDAGDAIEEYGFQRKSLIELTVGEASELINWLKSGGAPQEQYVEYLRGTRFSSASGAGHIIFSMSDGRCSVKFDDGTINFIPVSEMTIERF